MREHALGASSVGRGVDIDPEETFEVDGLYLAAFSQPAALDGVPALLPRRKAALRDVGDLGVAEGEPDIDRLPHTQLTPDGHDALSLQPHLGGLVEVAGVAPRIDGKGEGRLAAEQPAQRLRIDDVVDHGEEEAASGRTRADEGGGAVSETKVAVLDEPNAEAALAHELTQARLLVAGYDEDFLDPDRAQGGDGPLEERDPRQARERLRANAKT